MSNNYVLDVRTDKDLGSESFARSFLAAWSTQLAPLLRPEYFDLAEPVRRSFQKEGLELAVRTWVDNQMPLYLSRRKQPKLMMSSKWRPRKGNDPRAFPWGCTVWLDRSAGDELAAELFRFLIDYFDPAFASLSTEEDSRAKHWIAFQDRIGRVERYQGLDVTDVLPGVYWITFLGPGAMYILGRTTLLGLRAHKVEQRGQGHLVWAYPASSMAGTASGHEAEATIIEQLGRGYFFEKSRIDIETLKFSKATSALIEEKVAKRKAAPGRSKP